MEETVTIKHNWIKEDKPLVMDIIQKLPCRKDPKFTKNPKFVIHSNHLI